MKILMINYEFPPLGGGGGIFTHDLALELAKKHDVDVLTSRYPGLKKMEATDGVTVYRVPVPGRRSLSAAPMLSLLAFPLSGVLEGIRLMRGKRYDIINTHFAVPSGPAGLALSLIFGVPNVVSIHGGDIYDPSKKTSPHLHAPLRWAVRTVLNNASTVVAQSTNTRDNARVFYKPSKDLNIIPLGIPQPSFAPADRAKLSMRKDRTYLISVGRLVKRKGYDFLIKALGLLREQGLDLDLLLVGDGPEHAALKKLSVELGIADHILFLDSVDNEKKFQYLSAADMYVLSSLHEGFGLVILEAMFCGLPIVATNNGGQTDIVRDGINGLLVRPADTEALANAIRTLTENTRQSRTIGAHNREHFKQYGISAVAERYIELFDSVLASR